MYCLASLDCWSLHFNISTPPYFIFIALLYDISLTADFICSNICSLRVNFRTDLNVNARNLTKTYSEFISVSTSRAQKRNYKKQRLGDVIWTRFYTSSQQTYVQHEESILRWV